jgi:tyrosine-protein kinase Etk/Wzc
MEHTNSEAQGNSLIHQIVRFLAIIWQYRKFIIIATGAITLLVTIFCVISIVLPPSISPLPNMYEAQATLLVQENSNSDAAASLMAALGASLGTLGSSATPRDNGDLIIEVLSSRALLDALVEEFGTGDKSFRKITTKGASRKLMQKKVGYAYTSITGTLKISTSDVDPVLAKNLVNKTVELLDQWFSQNRGLAKQKQRQSLEDKLNEVKSTIDSLQGKIKSLQKRYGVLNVQELGENQASSLANLRSQLILKDVEIKNYTSFSKIDDPRLEQLKAERQNLLDLIAQTQQKLPESASSTGASGSQSLADVAQQFTGLTQELDIQQRIYNTLSPQYEAAKLSPESEPIFQILEWADVPDTKSGPRRPQIIMIAFALGLVLSIAASLLFVSLRKLNFAKLKELIQRGV